MGRKWWCPRFRRWSSTVRYSGWRQLSTSTTIDPSNRKGKRQKTDWGTLNTSDGFLGNITGNSTWMIYNAFKLSYVLCIMVDFQLNCTESGYGCLTEYAVSKSLLQSVLGKSLLLYLLYIGLLFWNIYTFVTTEWLLTWKLQRFYFDFLEDFTSKLWLSSYVFWYSKNLLPRSNTWT